MKRPVVLALQFQTDRRRNLRSVAVAFILLTAVSLDSAAAGAESSLGFTWKSLAKSGQGLTGPGYTHFGSASGRVLRPPFERALAGDSRAIAAFFDLVTIVDGEHAFTHRLMSVLLLDALGDKAFCRQLSRRSPFVQWLVCYRLYRFSPPDGTRVLIRFPRTLALAERWREVGYWEAKRMAQ